MPPQQQARFVVRHFKKDFAFDNLHIDNFTCDTSLRVQPFDKSCSYNRTFKKKSKRYSAYVEGIAIIVKGDNKILATTFADRQGNFEVTFTPNKEKSFDFFCFGVAVDTLLIGSVRTFESDTPDLTFYIPAITKKNFLGQTLCPKCNKADKVYKIRYGDGLPMATRHVSENGDITYSPIVNGHYNAGTCIVGVATFYCDRDRVRF